MLKKAGSWLWILLYAAYAGVYLYGFAQAEYKQSALETGWLALMPVMLILAAVVAESFLPYRYRWSVFNLQSINNVLYSVSSHYGDAWGKAVALGVLPFLYPFLPAQWLSVGFSDLPVYCSVPLGLLLYDLVYYWYHRACHYFETAWRIHRLHHTPEKLNTLAVFRFSFPDIFIELVLLTLVMKGMGVPDQTYSIMVGFMTPATILSHSNISAALPRYIDFLIISPDSHRIHHSRDQNQINKNFGGFTLFWDKVFGTYESSGQAVNEVGVANHQTNPFFPLQFFDFLRK